MSEKPPAVRGFLRLFSGGSCEVLGADHVARTPTADGSELIIVHEDHAETSSLYLRSDGILVLIPGGVEHIAGKEYDRTTMSGDVARGAAAIKSSGWRLQLVDTSRIIRHSAASRRTPPPNGLDALAILVGAPMTRVGVALWLRAHRFDYPARAFSDARAAIAWLTLHRREAP
jgi:hypothetical protein